MKALSRESYARATPSGPTAPLPRLRLLLLPLPLAPPLAVLPATGASTGPDRHQSLLLRFLAPRPPKPAGASTPSWLRPLQPFWWAGRGGAGGGGRGGPPGPSRGGVSPPLPPALLTRNPGGGETGAGTPSLAAAAPRPRPLLPPVRIMGSGGAGGGGRGPDPCMRGSDLLLVLLLMLYASAMTELAPSDEAAAAASDWRITLDSA